MDKKEAYFQGNQFPPDRHCNGKDMLLLTDGIAM